LALLLPPALLSASEPRRVASDVEEPLLEDAVCAAPLDASAPSEPAFDGAWAPSAWAPISESTGSARRPAPPGARGSWKRLPSAEDLARRGTLALLAAANVRAL
jgi:hypothetical protein